MSMLLSRFSIALRIGSGFLVVVGLMSAVTWAGLNALDDTRQSLELVVSRDAKNVREAVRMVQDIISLQRAEKNLILSRSQQEMDEYEKAISKLESSLRLRLHSLHSSIDEEGTEILGRFSSFFEKYIAIQKDIVALTRKNSNVEARKLSQGEGQRLYEDLSYLLESKVKESETEALKNAQNMDDKAVLKGGQANQILEAMLSSLENNKSILFEDSLTEGVNRVEAIEKAHQNIADSIQILEGVVQGAEVNKLSLFKQRWLKYAKTSDKILQSTQDGAKDKAKELYRKSGRTQHELALRILRQLIKNNEVELDKARKFIYTAMTKSQLGNRIIRNISKIHRAEKDLILTLAPTEMQRYSSRISLLRSDLRQQLDKLAALSSPSENNSLDEIRKIIHEFLRINQIVIEKSKENANHRAFDLSTGIARQFMDKSEQTLQELVAKNDRDMQAALSRADSDFLVSQQIGVGNAIFAIIICLLIAYLTIRFLIDRVEGLVARANAISVGEVTVTGYHGSVDELSEIDNALTAIASSYGNIANMAMQVVKGDFSSRLQLRSEQDQLSQAINQIISNMEAIISQAHDISQGLFEIEINPRSDRDRLSHALQTMAEELSKADRENKQQNWEQGILIELGQALQGNQSITELSNSVVDVLCRRLEAVSGLLYLLVATSDGKVLQLTGSSIFSNKINPQDTFNIGEGLVGQAILRRTPSILQGVTDSFTSISSGLGELRPDSLVFAPFYYEGEGRGVVELAFLHHPAEQKINFLGRVMETIAMTFETAQARPLAEALNESRVLTAELQETNEKLIKQSFDLEKAKQVLEERNTTLQQAQKELTDQAQKLKQSDRYKSDFLATMSHEIRTPMNGILGTAQILEKTAMTPHQKKLIDTIIKSGHSLLTIIDDILDLSKIEAGKLDLDNHGFELKTILDNVESLVSSRVIEKGLSLSINIDPKVPDVLLGDPARLRQVLLNLIGNAVKFTDNGSVAIKASVTTLDNDQRLHVEVHDTGIGIPQKTQDQLFQPFSQGDTSVTRRFGGTGLGLAICKRLVTAMGGEIGVKSSDGKGSLFWFKVPLVEGEIEDLPKIADPVQHLSIPLSVLLVEDEYTNQEVAIGMLEQLGCTTTLATGGEQAIEAVEKSSFDLVFMDIQMPGMDGWEASKKIRNLPDPKKAALPIIAMTAYAMQEDADRCYEAGMDGFMTKPMIMEKISETLNSIAAGKAHPSLEQTDGSITAANSTHALLDSDKLEKMHSDLSISGLNKIIDTCLDSLSKYCQAMEESFARQDLELAARQAHKLKGAAGACGLEKLYNFAESIEDASKKNSIADSSTTINELQELIRLSSKSLKAWRERVQTS
ncbi:MAG: response regulator [Magnetococcales bacterium]|nr:response regulator [Magnetococcales bacterium]